MSAGAEAGSPADPGGGPARQRVGGSARRGLHLAALSSLGIAQPLFDLFGRTPEFFATRGSTALDVAVFAIGVTVLPPLGLLAAEELVALASPRARRSLHLAFVAALSGLIVLQAVKRLGDGSGQLLVVLAAAGGIAVAAAYARAPGFRAFVGVLGVAPLLFLALFLARVPVAKLSASSEARAAPLAARTGAPVVFVVFDELPTTNLLDGRGRIDAERFPSFAALARRATWFPNATTVSDSTTTAVPVLLTGNLPRAGLLPVSADHPRNLFTALGGPYRLNVFEETTRLCPRRLCTSGHREGLGARMRSLVSDLTAVYPHVLLPDDLAEGLPPISNTWMNFRAGSGGPEAPTGLTGDRAARFRAFLRSLRPSAAPTVHLLHVLLPHGPWQYLPSGRRYGGTREPIPGLVGRPSLRTPWLVEQAYQRDLLQTAYADRLLGRLVARLRAQGLWGRAVVIVASDHGVAFRLGRDRRRVSDATVQDVAPVALFVKAPGQRRGRVDGSWVRTTDVLPTIADLLQVRLPWPVDGRSAFSAAVRRRDAVALVQRSGAPYRIPVGEFERRVAAAIARRQRLFGSGRARPGLYGIGPYPELVGRALDRLAVAPAGEGRAEIDQRTALRAVEPSSGFVPAHLTGEIRGAAGPPGRALAAAVNGRVEAVGWSFTLAGAERFSLIVPEAALRPGANDVRLLAVAGPPGRPRLTLLARAPGGAGPS